MVVCMFFDVVWLIMLAMSALCIKIAAEDSVSAVTCAVNIFVLCSVDRVVGMASSTLNMVRNLFTPCLAINQITNSFST